jgi:hypothetical protein
MRVVHVSTADSGGGAFRAAHRLHSGLRRLGVDSEMMVMRRGSADDRVFAYKPRQDWFTRWQRKRIAAKIWRDYEKYRPTIPPGVEPFSDDRTPYLDLLEQIPMCDVLNFHWVGGFVDWRYFFSFYPDGIPVVWRLADMGALTGGCHYDQGCGKLTATCGACPQLGSSDHGDLSRQIWQRKRDALDELSPAGMHIVGPSRWIAGEAKRSSLFSGFPVSVIPNGLDVEEFATCGAFRAMRRLCSSRPNRWRTCARASNILLTRSRDWAAWRTCCW